MLAFPPCKINLGLHVVGRRPDGYHDLETIFLPVHSLHDELEITPLPVTATAQLSTLNSQLSTTGILLDNAPDDNLCMKAWRLLHDELGIPPVSIRLHKTIPFGAGLGGGSSDAAFTLKLLNDLFSLGLTVPELERYAARLGADCAFFIQCRPAYATGIGDILTPIELSTLNSQFSILIEIPDGEHVSTKEAYAGIDNENHNDNENENENENRPGRIDLREAVKRPVEEWRHLIVNDFESSVFPAHSAIAALKADMYRRGAVYASMTGSGAAVFGLFPR